MQRDLACIDVHSHILPSFYCEAVKNSGRSTSISSGFPAWSAERAIEMMDRCGIATAIQSISQPGVHFGDDAQARHLARRCNELMAELHADYPHRFGGFAALPLPDVAGACDEIEYALDVLKLDGVGLLASYGERFLADPHFAPIWGVLNERAAVVFIHPNFHPRSRGIQSDLAAFLLEFPFDTTRAVTALIFSGIMERYPKIRFILAHAGGALPYLSWRLSLVSLIDAKYESVTRERIMTQLASCYFDVAQASGPQVLACLSEIAAPNHILFGSDWPYCSEAVGTATINALVDNQMAGPGIFRANSLPLFPRFI